MCNCKLSNLKPQANPIPYFKHDFENRPIKFQKKKKKKKFMDKNGHCLAHLEFMTYNIIILHGLQKKKQSEKRWEW